MAGPEAGDTTGYLWHNFYNDAKNLFKYLKSLDSVLSLFLYSTAKLRAQGTKTAQEKVCHLQSVLTDLSVGDTHN